MSAAERRQQIISLAAGLFDQGGYTNTTMDDIAGVVGVAKPTLYHYFPSKDDILHAIHEEFIDLLISRHEARAGTGLRPEQLLLEAMADILELMQTHRGHIRVFFEHHRELPAEAQGPIRVKRDRYEAMVEGIISDGIEIGVLRQTDGHLAALAVFGMCNWAYQWYRPDGRFRSREIAYQFWNYLIYGLGTESLGPVPTGRAGALAPVAAGAW
ncbi:MAG: TetR/AcrR family transcriptional regulator [Mycobacteriales bacterium]